MKNIILMALATLGLVSAPVNTAKPATTPAKVVAPVVKKPTTTAKPKPVIKPVVKPASIKKPAVVKKPVVKKPITAVKKVTLPTVSKPKLIEITLPSGDPTETPSAKPESVSTPDPFTMSDSGVSKSPLTVAGVLSYTNTARKDNGNIAPLKGSDTLNKVADLRLKDMFEKQYFAHVSPSGVGPSEVAGHVGYTYLTLGENIARGTFTDDAALVDAWMHSPHHRENIVNPKYQELGVAVGQGTYEGHQTWLAVQVFGTSASVCPEPDEALKNSIDSINNDIAGLAASANNIEAALKAMNPKTSAEIDAYNAKIAAYNELAKQISILNDSIKLKIKTYNAQSNSYNACVNG